MPDTLVWKAGFSSWLPLSQVPEFSSPEPTPNLLTQRFAHCETSASALSSSGSRAFAVLKKVAIWSVILLAGAYLLARNHPDLFGRSTWAANMPDDVLGTKSSWSDPQTGELIGIERVTFGARRGGKQTIDGKAPIRITAYIVGRRTASGRIMRLTFGECRIRVFDPDGHAVIDVTQAPESMCPS